MKQILSLSLLLISLLLSPAVFAVFIATDADVQQAQQKVKDEQKAVDDARAEVQAAQNNAKNSTDSNDFKNLNAAENKLKEETTKLQEAQAKLEDTKSRTSDALRKQEEIDRKTAEEDKRKAQEKQNEEKPQTKEDDRLEGFKTKVHVDANEFLKPAFDAKTRGQDYVKAFASLRATNPNGNLYVTVNGLKIKGVTECQEQGSMVVVTYKKGQALQQKVVKMEDIQDIGIASSSMMITTE